MTRWRDTRGQASVELVAVLPLAVLLALAVWQGVLAAQAAWSAAAAARAGARAQAVGADALRAARRAVPSGLRRGVRVRPDGDGVRATVEVPLVLGHVRLGALEARAALPPQR